MLRILPTLHGFFATVAAVSQQDVQRFEALARKAERCLEKLNMQDLANTAWAFAKIFGRISS